MVILHSKAMNKLPETIIALDDFHVPANVKEAEDLMQEDLKLKEDLVNMMAEAEVSIDRFLAELQEQNSEVELRPSTKGYFVMISFLNGLLEELKSKQEEFDGFWALHKARVDHMMKMCHFNRTTDKVGTVTCCHMIDTWEHMIDTCCHMIDTCCHMIDTWEHMITLDSYVEVYSPILFDN